MVNVEAARALRTSQAAHSLPVQAHYPYKEKPYQTVSWKDHAIRRGRGTLIVPNGREQPDRILPLPKRYHQVPIRKVELLWRADHYKLALTVEESAGPAARTRGQVVGIDLGEIHRAAAVTANGYGLVITGRYVRAIKRLRNERHAALTSKRDRCTAGSRRWKTLQAAKARASAAFYRQQRPVLHTASARLMRWLDTHGVSQIAIGDVRDIADGTEKGRSQNQKLSQWAHGQVVG